MNPRQSRILAAFVSALLITQCISIGFSHSPADQGLRVFMSPTLKAGSQAMVRLGIYDAGEHRYLDGVKFQLTVISRGTRMTELTNSSTDGFLDQRITVPLKGPAELEVWAKWDGEQQRIGIPLALGSPGEHVKWFPPWQTLGGNDPADPRSGPPKAGGNMAKTQVFPAASWAVRNQSNHLVLRLRDPETPPGSGWRVRTPNSEESLSDDAGFAELELAQPLNRGRYQIQVKGPSADAWEDRELWLHNPPSELAILPTQRSVGLGEKIQIELRSDRRAARYGLVIHHDAQWVDTVFVDVKNKVGTVSIDAPDVPGWVSVSWAADLLSMGRRQARASIRVGEAPWPNGIDDDLAHPSTELGWQALYRRILPSRIRPALRADTVIQRRGKIHAEQQSRRAWGLLAYDITATLLVLWLMANLFAAHRARREKFLAHQDEENEWEDGNVSNWRLVGTAGILLALLLLLYSIGYLLAHMQWSY